MDSFTLKAMNHEDPYDDYFCPPYPPIPDFAKPSIPRPEEPTGVKDKDRITYPPAKNDAQRQWLKFKEDGRSYEMQSWEVRATNTSLAKSYFASVGDRWKRWYEVRLKQHPELTSNLAPPFTSQFLDKLMWEAMGTVQVVNRPFEEVFRDADAAFKRQCEDCREQTDSLMLDVASKLWPKSKSPTAEPPEVAAKNTAVAPCEEEEESVCKCCHRP
jgi:Asp-tRNA(Asn)/Glu-tRNA(Gln) amidotransferase A subunit family amidase